MIASLACQSLFICGLSGVFRRSCLSRTAVGVAGLGFCLATALETAAYYTTGESFSLGFYQQLTTDVYSYAITSQRICLFAVLLILFILSACLLYVNREVPSGIPKAFFMLMTLLGGSGVFLLPSSTKNLLDFSQKIYSSKQIYALDPYIFRKSGVEISRMDTKGLKAKPGKNLVFIYMESIEQAFIDQRYFPGLMPNLNALARNEAIFFDNIIPAPNSGYTYAGIYSSMIGSYLVPANLRDGKGNVSAFGSRSISFPQVLHSAGYRQVFMRAAPVELASLNVLLTRCGFDETWASFEMVRVNFPGLPSDDNWGCFDSELLDKAFLKYQTLSASGAPFNLTLLTVDTHAPAGRIPLDSSNGVGLSPEARLRMAYSNTDSAIGKFIAKLKSSKEWSKTVVILMNDHRARPCALSQGLKAVPERKMTFMAVNAGPPRIIQTRGMPFDVAPTTLSLLGVEHNNVFPLGDDLLNTPDPRRLNCGPEQEECLTALMISESALKMEDVFSIDIDEVPYPSLALGDQRIPLLLIGGGGQETPRKEESFILVLDEHRVLSHYQRFLSKKDAMDFIKNISPDCRFIFIGAPDSCGAQLAKRPQDEALKSFWLVYGGGSQTISVHTAIADDLSIKKEDIANFEERLRKKN